MRTAVWILAALIAAASGGCKSERVRLPEGAALLFDVRFSPPEDRAGSPPRVHEAGTTQPFPSAIPSQIFMGQPQVVESLCGLRDQPVRLASATGTMGHEGLEFLLSQRYGRYHVELNLCVAQLGAPPREASEPQVAVFLDFPQAYAVGLFADGSIGLVDPARLLAGDTTHESIGAWKADVPLHLAIDADLEQHTWVISLDGKKAFEGKFDAYLARAVRVVVRGNESNQIAFDDFVVWGEHDLGEGEPEAPPKIGDE